MTRLTTPQDLSTRLKKRALFIAAAALATATPSAFGSVSLTNIPTMGTDSTNEARAMTPDAIYVVGQSGSTVGFLYNVTNGMLIQPSDPFTLAPAVGCSNRVSFTIGIVAFVQFSHGPRMKMTIAASVLRAPG